MRVPNYARTSVSPRARRRAAIGSTPTAATMTIKHNGYTFRCDLDPTHVEPLVIHAATERTAIDHAREKQWDIIRVRAVSGIPDHKVARTVRLVCCPGCSSTVGLRWK